MGDRERSIAFAATGSKEAALTHVKRFGRELGKQFWDLADTKRGRALYAAFFTELDVIPLFYAAQAGVNSAVYGNDAAIQPLVEAVRSSTSGAASSLGNTLNSVVPHAADNVGNWFHGAIQALGGPVQASIDITLATAIAIDYALYFVFATAAVKGVKMYLNRRHKNSEKPNH